MTRRTIRILLTALVALVAMPGAASAALPDLLSDPAESPYTAEHVIGSEDRLLLRFDSYIRNAATAGPVQVLADQPAAGHMGRVRQVVDGTPVAMPGAEVVYEAALGTTADGHNHWHLQRAARYALTTTSGAPVAPAAKVGFCLLNSENVDAKVPPGNLGACGSSVSTEVRMGISPGWRDLYSANLDFQWVDVSNVAPGTYRLSSQVDPDDVVDELGDELNAEATIPVRIPGHVPRSVAAPRTVELRTDGVEPMTGDLAAPRFRIVDAPQHGTIDRPTGTWFSDPVVTYTPDDPAAPVAEQLDYEVLPADSDFPESPPRAAMTFGSGEAVAISGHQGELVAGASKQLSATAGEPVTWTASAGSISSQGLFTAPATPGDVRVRASTASGSADAVTIRVVAPPPREAAPVPQGTVPGDPVLVSPPPLAPTPPVALPRAPLTGLKAQRIGRYVAVSALPGRAGRLRFVLRRNGRTVDDCRVRRAVPGRSATCRLMPPRKGAGKLRVVVQLHAGGRVVSRTLAVRSGHLH